MGKIVSFASPEVIKLQEERNRLILISQELNMLLQEGNLKDPILLVESINSINNTVVYLDNLKQENSLKRLKK
jgi:hypothetical protein